MLLIFFATAFVANLLLQPWLPFQLFFPLLALATLRSSRIKALWIAALAGVFLDLLGSDGSLGLHATIFAIVTMVLYSYRRFFFEEKWLPFTFYATFFGSLASFLVAFTITCQGARFNWSLDFIAIDLLLLPLCDACLGWVLFVAPKIAFRFSKRLLLEWRWRTS